MDEPKPTAGKRMRRHRQRRRAGYRCITVEIGERDVAGLIRRWHLDPESRNDCTAIRGALHAWSDKSIAGG